MDTQEFNTKSHLEKYSNFPPGGNSNYMTYPILVEEEDYDFDDPLSENVYESLRFVRDPEFPQYTLVNLGVIQPDSISVSHQNPQFSTILVTFKPTSPYCSMASIIGLSIRKKLENEFGTGYKIDLAVTKDSHTDEEHINRKMNDKERVIAAFENPHLSNLIENAIDEEGEL